MFIRPSSVMCSSVLLFFFNDTATTEIYTLSLHDALPISAWALAAALSLGASPDAAQRIDALVMVTRHDEDRKSTRLNSSHITISYAVFCLKKKTTAHRSSRTSGGRPTPAAGSRAASADRP